MIEEHHAVPRCLLRLHDQANGELRFEDEPMSAHLEFEVEARRWSVEVTISRQDLEELIETSTEIMDREKHRLIHASDWQRWGRRGGRETFRRYGSSWFAALALKRHGRIDAADLDQMRVVR